MKRFAILASSFFLFAASLWAQPKIAVLDAIIPRGMDRSVVVPVTEKVVEPLVKSGRYTVLDRANVEQVLREREFQVSGLVSDAEITEAGKYLGADFIVVIKVERVAETYFLSAKMITVKTGVIANQSSAEQEGKLSILLVLAERAGDILAGGTGKTAYEAPPAKEKSAARRAPPAPQDARSIGLRLYGSLGGGTARVKDNSGNESYDAYGASLYAMLGLGNRVFLAGNITYLDASEEYGPILAGIDAGLGYAYPIGILLPWGAIKAGYSFIDWSDFYGVSDPGNSALEYGLEAGLDLRLGRFLVGARYQLMTAAFVKYGYYDLSSTQSIFWLMAGYRL